SQSLNPDSMTFLVIKKINPSLAVSATLVSAAIFIRFEARISNHLQSERLSSSPKTSACARNMRENRKERAKMPQSEQEFALVAA
ncbi:MAG: hypothetical protein R8K53_05160, partial [Mariprofundaceae bacterium]